MHATWLDPVAVWQGLTCGRWQWRKFGAPPSVEEFELVLRQTRDPRKVASSIGKTAKHQDTWGMLKPALEARLGVDFPWPPDGDKEEHLAAGVAYTYWWYIYAGLDAEFTYKVENMRDVLPRILTLSGHNVSKGKQRDALEKVDTNAGSRQEKHGYDYWSWEELERVRWGEELRAMARSFGYE
jgi:hypothetical protein